MAVIFQSFEQSEDFQRLVAEVRSGRKLVNIAGLNLGAKALAIAALQKAAGKRLAPVVVRGGGLEEMERDLRFFYCALNDRKSAENEVFTLPSSEGNPYSGTSPHAEVLERRALALWRLTAGHGDIVLLTVRSLMRRISGWRLKKNNYTFPLEQKLFHVYVRLIGHRTQKDLSRRDTTSGVTPHAPSA